MKLHEELKRINEIMGVNSNSNFNLFETKISENKNIIDTDIRSFIFENADSTQALNSQSKQFGVKIPPLIKIRQKLDLGPNEFLTPEVIKSYEKQKGLPDSGGKLTGGNLTFLSLLKGEPPVSDQESETPTNVNEPQSNKDLVSEGLIPTTQDGWLSAFNSVLGTIKKSINNQSPLICKLLTSAAKKEIKPYYENCYTTDLYITSFETCFGVGVDFNINSFSIDTLSLSKHENGKSIVGTGGATVKGWIFIGWWGEKGTNIYFTVNATIPISMYQFQTVRLHTPTINISTDWIDCTVCDVKLKNNYLKVYNSVFGTRSWDLGLQSSINSMFTTKGLNFETDVAKQIKSAYVKL